MSSFYHHCFCVGERVRRRSRISLLSAVVAGKTFYPNHYETLCLGPDECVSSVHFQAVDVLLKVLQFKK